MHICMGCAAESAQYMTSSGQLQVQGKDAFVPGCGQVTIYPDAGCTGLIGTKVELLLHAQCSKADCCLSCLAYTGVATMSLPLQQPAQYISFIHHVPVFDPCRRGSDLFALAAAGALYQFHSCCCWFVPLQARL